MNNRHIRIIINDYISTSRELLNSIIHDTMLNPPLFSMHVNDIFPDDFVGLRCVLNDIYSNDCKQLYINETYKGVIDYFETFAPKIEE